MPRRERHIRLTEDPDVRRWYQAFDSDKTRKDRLRQLGLFCGRMGTPRREHFLSRRKGRVAPDVCFRVEIRLD